MLNNQMVSCFGISLSDFLKIMDFQREIHSLGNRLVGKVFWGTKDQGQDGTGGRSQAAEKSQKFFMEVYSFENHFFLHRGIYVWLSEGKAN